MRATARARAITRIRATGSRRTAPWGLPTLPLPLSAHCGAPRLQHAPPRGLCRADFDHLDQMVIGPNTGPGCSGLWRTRAAAFARLTVPARVRPLGEPVGV